MTGQLPYPDIKHSGGVMVAIMEGTLLPVPEKPAVKDLSDNIWNLWLDCWGREPGDRASIHDISHRLNVSGDDVNQALPSPPTSPLDSDLAIEKCIEEHAISLPQEVVALGRLHPIFSEAWSEFIAFQAQVARLKSHPMYHNEMN